MPIPDFRDDPVLVTGGAGFIGSHLVHALVERGAKVTVLDDLSNGHEENLAGVRNRIRFIKGDIRDPEVCRDAVAGAALVFHQAARGSVPRSLADPVGTIDVNVRGTATVFTACRDAKVERVVYASSSSVYGDGTALPKREGEEGAPLSPYALSKTMNEQLAAVFARCFGMRLIGLRYFNVYGPRQDPNGPYAAVVPRFFSAALGGEPLVIFGDGEQSRDFTHVSDVVRANLMAAGAPDPSFGKSYNIAQGGNLTVRELAGQIIRICSSTSQPRFENERPGDVKHSRAATEKARLAFGFEATMELRQALEQTACWYRSERTHSR